MDGTSKRIRRDRVRREREAAAALPATGPAAVPAAGVDPMMMSDSVAAVRCRWVHEMVQRTLEHACINEGLSAHE